MANQNARQGSGNQPIVRHPLFPTVVAFWFAALFGLGSLAVRTSLLETLVIASKIDLIVPQTAPPLGMTARILIALAMAAIGSIIGFILALRLARPRPEKQERVRTARGFGGSNRASAASSYSEEGEDERSPEPERRRSLIALEGESAFDDEPGFIGGMAPHILDVTKFDFDPIDQEEAEPEQAPDSAAALELDQFATTAPVPAPGFETFAAPQAVVEAPPEPEMQVGPPENPIPQPVPMQTFDDQAQAEPAIQSAFAPPVAEDAQSFAAPAALPFSESVEQVEATQPEVAVGEPEPEVLDAPAPPAFVAPVTSPLQFSVARAPIVTPVVSEPAPVQSEGLAIAAPASPQEAPAIAGEADHADPLAAFRNKVAPMPVFDAEPEDPADAAAMYGVSTTDAEPMTDPQPAADPEPVAESQPVSSQLVAPMGAAAERLMNANLSDLSPVELVERLALSLQRRGQALTVATAAVPQAAVVPAVAVAPEQPALATEPVAPAPGLAEVAEVEEAPQRLTLPAAMRPIDFSQYEHHDEELPTYVPARSISMPSPEAAEVPEHIEQAQPVVQAAEPEVAPAMGRFGRQADAEENSAPSEDEVLEAGYSSLLDMSRPAGQRQQFVRVIDPEAETEVAEPVVIFPGQAMRAGTTFAGPSAGPVVAPTAPPPSLGEMASHARRFDAPGAAQSQPAQARSPEETERALRSALSTLQRMSGAA